MDTGENRIMNFAAGSNYDVQEVIGKQLPPHVHIPLLIYLSYAGEGAYGVVWCVSPRVISRTKY